jgi:hypothetical protein
MHTLNKPPVVVKAGAAVEVTLDLVNLAWSTFEPGMTLPLFLYFAFCSALPIGAAFAAYFCRNWGRVVLLVLWVVGAAVILFMPFFSWPNAPGFFLIGSGVALVLLFSPPANRWYREEAEALRAV